ncbi:MAG TPA: DUF423 domain-containing protein [Gemmatimonadales bacterium]
MSRGPILVGVGALSALVAVALGAFGAHGLRGQLTPDLAATFDTAARYQMYHALGLVAAGLWAERRPGAAVTAAGWLFLAGTLFFSGSLYLLALTGTRWLGAVAPVGGTAWIAGWGLLAVSALRPGEPRAASSAPPPRSPTGPPSP